MLFQYGWNSMAIKVLHIISSLGEGGVERMLAAFIRGSEGRFVHRVAAINDTGIFSKGLPPDTVTALGRRCRIDAGLPFRIKRIINEFSPDIIQTYAFTGNLWGRLAAALSGRKAVTYERGTAAAVNPFFDLIDRTLSFAETVRICNSETSRILAEKKSGIKKTTVVENFISPGNGALYEPSSDGKIRIAVVGRLHWKRGAFLLPQIVKRALERSVQTRFIITGSGPLKEQLEKDLSDEISNGTVEFTGRVDDPETVYKRSDMGLFLNLTESFGNALCEFLARGIPVVAPDCDNFPFLAVNGENAVLYEKTARTPYRFVNVCGGGIRKGLAGDPEIIAASIMKMISDLGTFRAKAGSLRSRYLKFSAERYISEIGALYESLLFPEKSVK